jgi:hypothetical protein
MERTEHALPHAVKSRKLCGPPKRLNPRIETVEPIDTKLKTDRELPNRPMPKSEHMLPTLALLRRENCDEMCTKLNALNELPMRTFWRIDRLDPNLAMPSTETDEPNRAPAKMLNLEPICDVDLSEIMLPNCAKSNTLIDDAQIVRPKTDANEPRRTIVRTLIAEPIVTKLKADKAEPMRQKDLMETEEPHSR